MLKSLIAKWRSWKAGLVVQNSSADEAHKESVDEIELTVECPTHGTSYPTFICKHLNENPIQQWFCVHPTQNNPWPDAWCSECNELYEREGEWNENFDSNIKIELLCDGCYEEKKAKSIRRLSGENLHKWETWSSQCCDDLEKMQDELADRFRINDYPRWDYQQESAELIFSGADMPDLIAEIEFVGSVSTTTDTFKWSWSNFDVLEKVRSKIGAVRDFGDENDFPHLTIPKWEASQIDGWLMAAVAAKILGGVGVYRAPYENGFLFMLILSIGHREISK